MEPESLGLSVLCSEANLSFACLCIYLISSIVGWLYSVSLSAWEGDAVLSEQLQGRQNIPLFFSQNVVSKGWWEGSWHALSCRWWGRLCPQMAHSLRWGVLVAIVQSLSCVWLFAALWTTACQASMSLTISQSLPKFISTELMMLSNHLILYYPLLLPSVFGSGRDDARLWTIRI